MALWHVPEAEAEGPSDRESFPRKLRGDLTGGPDRRMIVPFVRVGRERPRIHDKLRAIIGAYRGEPTADASYNS